MRTLPGRPIVWCVAGIAGSGKSTLAKELAAKRLAMLVDQDTATNPLMAQIAALVGAGDDLDHPALGADVRTARYRCLVRIATENVALGNEVVLVAPFTEEVRHRGAWHELVTTLRPAEVNLVWVVVPAAVAAERRRARALPRDRSAQQRSRTQSVVAEPVVGHITADGQADSHSEAARISTAVDGGRTASTRPSHAQ